MHRKKSINLLNQLIRNNKDRMQDYEQASAKTYDMHWKVLFKQLANTSVTNQVDLIKEVEELNGAVEVSYYDQSNLLKEELNSHRKFSACEEHDILIGCAEGEEMINDSYQFALDEQHFYFTERQVKVIYDQHELLILDGNRLRKLKAVCSCIEHLEYDKISII
jgi:hypothetical protein